MKKFNRFLLIAVALVGFGLTICSCNKDEPGDEGDGEQVVVPDTPGDYEVGWQEDGNTVKFTITENAGYYNYTATYTCTFDDNDLCISAIVAYEFSDKTFADAFYQGMILEYESVSQNGKVVTVDQTEDYEGISKADLRETYERLKEGSYQQ